MQMETSKAIKEQTMNMPALALRAAVAPGTVNEAERTVEIVWTRGARVLRQPWFSDAYFEELEVTEKAVRMGRMNGGAPLLNSHNAMELQSVIGVVEKAWLKDGEGRAIVRFSDREDVAPIWRDVQKGIIRNVSVGYSVYRYADVTPDDDKIRVLRAIDWEPMEVSLVAIGADAGAGVRDAVKSNPCIVERAVRTNEKKEKTMEKDMEKTVGEQPTAVRKEEPAAAQPVNVDAVRKKGAELERTRILEIRKAVSAASLEDAVANELIEKGAPLDQARAAIIEKMAARQSSNINPAVRVEMDGGEKLRQQRMAAVENALLHRHNPAKETLTGDGRDFRGLSLRELARELLRARNIDTKGMAVGDIAQRSLSTSDFPLILANVANKTLRGAYEASPQTFRPFCRQTNLNDFKEVYRNQLGEAPKLVKVNENGEIKYGSLSESRESYHLESYAVALPLTRKTIINDDLNAFTRLPEMLGASAADLESDIVWSLIVNNVELKSDGKAMFHADHKNIGTKSLGVDGLSLGRTAMYKQTGLDAKRKMQLNLAPQFLAVPPELQTVAQQIMMPIAAVEAAKVNPFVGSLQPIVEARLSADGVSNGDSAWYMIASPGRIDTIEIAYLDGNTGPTITTEEGFDVDGVKIKCSHDFGAGLIDFRGFYKSTGTVA